MKAKDQNQTFDSAEICSQLFPSPANTLDPVGQNTNSKSLKK